MVAINHRLAALRASAFDVLFALNRVPHPGEKRLLALASRLPLAPADLRSRVEAMLSFTPRSLERVLPTSTRSSTASSTSSPKRTRCRQPPSRDAGAAGRAFRHSAEANASAPTAIQPHRIAASSRHAQAVG
jgi:hypothetical protein